MENETYQKIIENYISAYNRFDVEGMLADMDSHVRFENISNGEINLATQGTDELRKQAEQAIKVFKERKQTIMGFQFNGNQVEVQIHYTGILNVDLPNGLKAADKIELNGKSIFIFKDDRIIGLKDIS